jgi:hypothetical protein
MPANESATLQRIAVLTFTPCIRKKILKSCYEFDKLPSTAKDREIILALAKD